MTVVIAQIVAALGAGAGERVRGLLPRQGARAGAAALYALRRVLAGDLPAGAVPGPVGGRAPAGDGTGGPGTGRR
ncbi:hypothetical protein OG689_43280 [Kitasatospora sp. NBC_00240]|uniref:hypothetical protein n=1 Tax=Kitasatospora sp. NBC_00240 TaxID=2903567 RepID=UPI00224E2EBD|nr:hypothetical protein [Kitasatospora sp. NBC_00240]MCX5215964.1 hypothetical protein [Kitasatospora sp. NBC_00240]